MAALTQSNDGNEAMAHAEEPVEPEATPKLSGPPQKGPKGGGTAAPKPAPRGTGFFTIYKKGQGYWTRMGTVIGAGFLGAMFAWELYHQIPTFLHGTQTRDNRIAVIVSLSFLAVYSLWAYWFINRPTTVDFLIATDSEMKKVNWTTRAELIGSTKIVILFMFIIAVFLFACDLLFGGFFHLIGVLKTWF